MAMVLLIRHGRSTANALGQLAGRSPGVFLTKEGRDQALALAGYLAADKAYSSPMERCLETAKLSGFAEAETRDELTEVDYGEYTGKEMDAPEVLRLWRSVCSKPSQVAFPGGESLSDVRSRVLGAIAEIVELNRGRVVAVFTHADPIKLILADCLGMPFDSFQRIDVLPGSVSAVDFRWETPIVRMVGGGPTAGNEWPEAYWPWKMVGRE